MACDRAGEDELPVEGGWIAPPARAEPRGRMKKNPTCCLVKEARVSQIAGVRARSGRKQPR